MQAQEKCPCCSGKSYSGCCMSFINGISNATSPLQLMRSRYTAFVLNNIEYIDSTMAGPALQKFDKNHTVNQRFKDCEWYKLEIFDYTDVTELDIVGYVEFKAHYLINGTNNCVQHERSEFRKIDNKWYYTSGIICIE